MFSAGFALHRVDRQIPSHCGRCYTSGIHLTSLLSLGLALGNPTDVRSQYGVDATLDSVTILHNNALDPCVT